KKRSKVANITSPVNAALEAIGVVMNKVFAFSLLAFCVGCSSGDGDPLQSEISTNNVEIISISPDTAEEGVNTEFTVTISYELVDFDQGEVNIGFNVDEQDSYTIIYDQVVSKGAGSFTAIISAVPVEYAPNGSFEVYANISEYPHPNTWTPLASDFKAIVITQNMGATLFQSMDLDDYNLICYTNYEEQCINF
ncbi:MAG: hypothetical protein ACJAS1_006929, partial [Oleiphilaceae bacterium]